MAIVTDLIQDWVVAKSITLPLSREDKRLYFRLLSSNEDRYQLGSGVLACYVDGVEQDWGVSLLPDMASFVEVVIPDSWATVGAFIFTLTYTEGIDTVTFGAASIEVVDYK